jgi:hypothetical protein
LVITALKKASPKTNQNYWAPHPCLATYLFKTLFLGLLTVVGCFEAFAQNKTINILFVGDSMSDGVGAAVQRIALKDNCLAKTLAITRKAEIGSGLARQDKFSWNNKIRSYVNEKNVDLVVASFGLNDRTNIANGDVRVDYKAPNWNSQYELQVKEFVQNIATTKASLVWLGIPILRDTKANEDAQNNNKIYRKVISGVRQGNATFVEPWRSEPEGEDVFRSYVSDKNGLKALVRATDGVHFTATGYDLVGQHLIPILLQQIEQRFGPIKTLCQG